MSENKEHKWIYIDSVTDTIKGIRKCFDICKQIGESTTEYICEILDEEDARRIVACVNFCKGRPTELLEAAVDFDNAPEDAEWEAPHTIFRMAEDIDRLRTALTAAEETIERLTVLTQRLCDHAMGWTQPVNMDDKKCCNICGKELATPQPQGGG